MHYARLYAFCFISFFIVGCEQSGNQRESENIQTLDSAEDREFETIEIRINSNNRQLDQNFIKEFERLNVEYQFCEPTGREQFLTKEKLFIEIKCQIVTSEDVPSRKSVPTTATNMRDLLNNWDRKNNICRGGSGDASDEACLDRDKIGQQLDDGGWCRGKVDEWVGDAEWHVCTERSCARQPSGAC